MDSLRRRARRASGFAWATLALALLFPSLAQSSGPRLDRGLAVVLDPQTLERSGTIGPQQLVRGYVVLLAHDMPINDGVRALQFGIEADPRLLVIDTELDPVASIPIAQGELSWAVGFQDCLELNDLPQVLLEFSFVVAPGVDDLNDLRIQLTRPADLTNPLEFVHCRWTDWYDALADFGGVILNPSGPSVLSLTTNRQIVVEGRDYELGWITAGADSVVVDGEAVDAEGTLRLTANGSRTHEVRAFSAGNESHAQTAIEVLRAPRIAELRAHDTSEFGPLRTQISWRVDGADQVELIGVGNFPPISTQLVVPNATGVWEIVARNEWGTTTATVETIDLATLPPVIVRLTASPTFYLPGEDVRLDYLVLGADTVRIEPEVGPIPGGSGSVVVRPAGAVTYTLIATNANGTSTRDLALTPEAPRIETFTALPARIDRGDPVVVRWRVTGADRVTLSPDVGEIDPQSGELVFEPTHSMDFRLTATNQWGETSEWRSVAVQQPAIHYFWADRTSIFPGESVLLGWGTSASTRLELGPPEVELLSEIGTWPITVEADSTRFWLRLEAPTDTIVRYTPMIVWKSPLLTVVRKYLSPTRRVARYEVRPTGAESLTIEPGIGSVDPTGGLFEVEVSDTTEVVFRAVNRAGEATYTERIEPIFVAPRITTLSATPTSVYAGGTSSLTVAVVDADSVRIDPSPGRIPPSGGTFDVSVNATTTFVVSAYGRELVGQVLRPVVVTKSVSIGALPPTVELTASPSQVGAGANVLLRATSNGARTLTLEPGIGEFEGPSADFLVPVYGSTTFVLRATNPLGTAVDSVHVQVLPPEIRKFAAVDSVILRGETTLLNWESRGSRSIGVEGDDGSSWSGLAEVGSQEVAPVGRTTYSLVVENDSGTESSSVVVDVVPFAIREFSATHFGSLPGQPVTLRWRVDGEAEVEVEPLGPQPSIGSITFIPDATRVFTLRARNGARVDTRVLDLESVPITDAQVQLTWSLDNVPGTFEGVPRYRPFEVYVLGEVGTPSLMELAFRLVMPPGIQLLDAEGLDPRFTISSVATADFLLTSRGACVPALGATPLAKLTLMGTGISTGDAFDLSLAGSTAIAVIDDVPAIRDCSGIVHPIGSGTPLHASSGFISAVTVDLVATPTASGVALDWSSTSELCASRARVLRATGDGAPEIAQELDVTGPCAPTQWLDPAAPAGSVLRYRVEVETEAGTIRSSEVRVEPRIAALPTRSRLQPNVPNPFNPRTELRFELAVPGDVSIEIHDVAGRRVRNLVLGRKTAGPGSVEWNGDDDRGRPVASGVYLVTLRATDAQDRRRVVLVR